MAAQHEHGEQSGIAGTLRDEYVGDAVLGAIDGIITTFAVVAGAVGGQFSPQVVVVLGVASVLADGFSMGVSNYLSRKSERERVEKARAAKRGYIQRQPEHAEEDLRDIYQDQGFEGPLLDQVVAVVTEERRRWADVIVRQEMDLQEERPPAVRSGIATALAFMLAGMVPLIPYLFSSIGIQQAFIISAVIAAITFFGVGMLRGFVLQRSAWRAGFETLAIGGGAAVLAFFVGRWIRQAYGVSETALQQLGLLAGL